MSFFKVLHKDGKARVGKLVTPHGVIETPNFIPVGTQGTVKALSPRDLKEIRVQVILANTYHLMLRPGAEVIKKLGGLHKFMGWSGPIMIDSGGFQVFSLGIGLESGESKVQREMIGAKNPRPKLAEVTEEGVAFQSHLDGKKFFLGPEQSLKIQHQLGADLLVAFDDHESINQDYDGLLKSLELTERWGLRSLKAAKLLKSNQLIYGVVHGALNKDLRIRSAKFTDENFDGVAIGGIYGRKKDLYQIIEWVANVISNEKPRHLLGIGEVEDIFNGVKRGMDLFDCVAPMRRARNGSLYISPKNGGKAENNFTLNIRMAKFTLDKKPIDPGCFCYTCQNFERAYLNHLYRANEILYSYLGTYHNVYFIENLMRQVKEAIKEDRFKKLKKEWLKD